MSGKSSALTEYSSGLTGALREIKDDTIPINDRFKVLADVIQSGANVVQEQHKNTLTLQDRVETLELTVERAEAEIQHFSDQERKRLEEEITIALEKLKIKGKLADVASYASKGTLVASFFSILALVGVCPFSIFITVPSFGLSTSFILLTTEKCRSIEGKIWILKNYPEALHDDDIREQASKEWHDIKMEEAEAEDREIERRGRASECRCHCSTDYLYADNSW
ncbi:MAG: hypothetical protein K940chlam1_00658 [Candidatus Anoxychlamydiales bacterium]|nr:hypothetical protein [Candidatus Anoxychlamydiales bacterium]NGX36065.1 hypothetical protein [Candidatus Anoxychlamydiales bacterium]